MNNNLVINNIQRFCFHDGPGVRTTVFMNSCPLKCPWCANPESSKSNKNYIVNGNCKQENDSCAYGILCNGKQDNQKNLEKNYNRCPVGAIEKLRESISIEKIESKILEDQLLYGTEGGVTFSGGEPLLQSKTLSLLLTRLKNKRVNIALETCLFVPQKNLIEVIDLVDLFIIDIKILNANNCLNILAGDIGMFFENVKTIFSFDKKVIFRIPLIFPFVTNKENLIDIYDFLKKFKPLKVELLKGHNLAKEKYNKLDIEYKKVETITDKEIASIKTKIERLNIEVEVMKF